MSRFKVGDKVVHNTWPEVYIGIVTDTHVMLGRENAVQIIFNYTDPRRPTLNSSCRFPWDEITIVQPAKPPTPEQLYEAERLKVLADIEATKDYLRTPIERRVRKSWNASNYVKKHPEQAY